MFNLEKVFILCVLVLAYCHGFRNSFGLRRTQRFRSLGLQSTIPMELEGKLDPKKSWDVTFIFEGEEKVVNVPETESLLNSGNKIFDDNVPFSCLNGVCVTCACQVKSGRENVKTAIQSLGEPQLAAGFLCACQSYPGGPGIVVKLGAYDECYESQYGQFEKSYGDLKYSK